MAMYDYMKIENALYITERDSWRSWLRENHESENEVWLIFYKKHTGRPSIAYIDAVEEAICFGWIDSIVQKMDEERYAQKFTPRRRNSKWSEVNKERVKRLISEGKMTPAGLAKFDLHMKDGGVSSTHPKNELTLSEDLLKTLKSHPTAWENFKKLPPSHRKNFTGWIMSAKREDTRQRRLSEAIELLSQNRKLGMK